MLLTRDKAFYKSFSALFWPLVLQNVINLAVNLADNIMLGRYAPFPDAALAGATVVNNIQFILQCLIGGVTGGITVLGSQYWGTQRIGPIKRIASMAFWVSAAFTLLIFFACALFPHGVLGLFVSNAPDSVREGVKYLGIIKYSYPVFSVAMILLAAFNCVETVKIAFWISVEALVVNVGLNFVLIPQYGSEGAAAATALARLVGLAIVIVYALKFDQKLRLRLRDFLVFDRDLFRDFARVTLPLVAISGLWGFSTAIQTAILGHMPSFANAIAANSVATTAYNLTKAAAQGSAAAAAILMAKTVGAGDLHKVRDYTKTLQIMFIGIGIVSGFLLYILKFPIFAAYKVSDDTIALANQFIYVFIIATIGMAYQMPTVTGIIRGGGDTKFGMINDIISIWLIVLPLSILAAFKFGWPPVAVVACLNSDQVFKCGAASIRCNRYKWVRRLTRDEVH